MNFWREMLPTLRRRHKLHQSVFLGRWFWFLKSQTKPPNVIFRKRSVAVKKLEGGQAEGLTQSKRKLLEIAKDAKNIEVSSKVFSLCLLRFCERNEVVLFCTASPGLCLNSRVTKQRSNLSRGYLPCNAHVKICSKYCGFKWNSDSSHLYWLSTKIGHKCNLSCSSPLGTWGVYWFWSKFFRSAAVLNWKINTKESFHHINR